MSLDTKSWLTGACLDKRVAPLVPTDHGLAQARTGEQNDAHGSHDDELQCVPAGPQHDEVEPAGTVNLGPIPDSLTVTTANGETFTLNRQQVTHAATIIAVGNGITDVGRPGITIALMAALTESTLRMLTNTSPYPESAMSPTTATAATTTPSARSRCARNRDGVRSPN